MKDKMFICSNCGANLLEPYIFRYDSVNPNYYDKNMMLDMGNPIKIQRYYCGKCNKTIRRDIGKKIDEYIIDNLS